MKITYASMRIEKIVCKRGEAQKAYGEKVAQVLANRLEVLQCVDSLRSFKPRVPPECFEELVGDRKGTMSTRLGQKWRLIFRPIWNNQDAASRTWRDIREVELLEICDYH